MRKNCARTKEREKWMQNFAFWIFTILKVQVSCEISQLISDNFNDVLATWNLASSLFIPHIVLHVRRNYVSKNITDNLWF